MLHFNRPFKRTTTPTHKMKPEYKPRNKQTMPKQERIEAFDKFHLRELIDVFGASPPTEESDEQNTGIPR